MPYNFDEERHVRGGDRKSLKKEIKSFPEESCFGSICFAFITKFLPLKRDQRNLGITAIGRLSVPGV
jgi:hypothetical protein